MKKRTRARELALQFLYQLDLLGDGALEGLPAFLRQEEKDAQTCKFARRIVEHFGMGEYFVEVFGSELDGTRTDKTELLAWARAGAAADSVMVGDRYHDMIGARNNEFRAIGVTWGYGSSDELLDAGAHELAETPADLARLV